jgi:hypothetical protein
MMGMSVGCSDLFIAYPVPPYAGMFLELKRTEGGRIGIEQQRFVDRMGLVGYKAVICMGWVKAKEAIELYLKGI